MCVSEKCSLRALFFAFNVIDKYGKDATVSL